jgi:hypothetical protein
MKAIFSTLLLWSVSTFAGWVEVASYQTADKSFESWNGFVAPTGESIINLYNISGGSAQWMTLETIPNQPSVITDTFLYAEGQNSIPEEVLISNSGIRIVVGRARDTASVSHSIIRKKTEAGWKTVDDFQVASGKDTAGRSIVEVSETSFLIAADGVDPLDNRLIYFRLSDDQGETWSTLSTLKVKDNLYHVVRTLSRRSDGLLAVMGVTSSVPTGFDSYPFVAISKDNGLNWLVVDEVTPSVGKFNPQNASFGESGRFFVSGIAENKYAFVRASNFELSSWSTMDLFWQENTSRIVGHGVAEVNGEIYHTGANINLDGSQSIFLRRSIDSGSTWESLPSYKGTEGLLAGSMSTLTDSNGNFYITGYDLYQAGDVKRSKAILLRFDP